MVKGSENQVVQRDTKSQSHFEEDYSEWSQQPDFSDNFFEPQSPDFQRNNSQTNSSVVQRTSQPSPKTPIPHQNDLPTNSKRKKKKEKLNTIFAGELLDEAEAFLLNLIFDRPLLFDYKIPIIERNPVSLSRSWQEVQSEMNIWISERSNENAKVTVDVLKDTWNNIRTSYMRYKNSQKLPSGSSPSKKSAEIKHLDLLKRYDSVNETRRTLSSLDGEFDEEYAEEREKNLQPPKRKGKVNDEFLNVAKKVLHNVSARLDKSAKENIVPEPASSTRHFVESLVSDLESLKGRCLASAKMRITQVIYEEMSKQFDETN